MLRHGVFLPPFNDLSDPHRLIALASSAEERGWDGFFLWDHVLRAPEQAIAVADPWVALAGVALATTRMHIGTMVTPLVRRRPQVLARQVVTLDILSRGRVILGLGLGVDTSGELSRFGEIEDPHERGAMLDEGADLLARLFEGTVVDHRGKYFVADGVQMLPTALQQPRVPMWFGARGGRERPVRRAAAYDGLFLIDARPKDLRRALDVLRDERGDLDGFDIAVLSEPETDLDYAYELGVTWAMLPVRPEWALAEDEKRVGDGPPRSA
ncbi:MAG: LLM class flavin-dependent oxidoreductase [Acidimicrobiales bacterium]